MHMLTVLPDLLAALPADVPNPGGGEAPPGSDGLIKILKWAAWIFGAICVLGVLGCAGAMVLNNKRGQGGEHMTQLGWILAGCIIGSSASLIVGALL
jgi:hypothetical protein